MIAIWAFALGVVVGITITLLLALCFGARQGDDIADAIARTLEQESVDQ